jgi:predicted nucleic acid-binding protein
VAEPGSEDVVAAMRDAARRVVSRVGYVEATRAIGVAAGRRSAALRRFEAEWPSLDVVEVDQRLAEGAARLALDHDLRTLDSLHLASALALPGENRVLATWDRRLREAARARGVELLPPQPVG